MTIHHRLAGFYEGNVLVVLVRTQGDAATGKFLLGRHLVETNLMALVFNDAAVFHSNIARKYHIHPLGGGILEIDSEEQMISLNGASKVYDREACRELTHRALLAALPDWQISVE